MYVRTIAAANKGHVSNAFRCAPRARTREVYVGSGTLDFRASRFVRGWRFVNVVGEERRDVRR